ncbi:hypothetical protein ACLB1N_22385 [Escherichia coli]
MRVSAVTLLRRMADEHGTDKPSAATLARGTLPVNVWLLWAHVCLLVRDLFNKLLPPAPLPKAVEYASAQQTNLP